MKPLFQRMNFFKGLFTKAEDWQKEQSYHMEKRSLHHRCFYTPGVVTAEAGDDILELKESLRVSVTPQGSITVQPGYALDGEGRDLYLPAPKELDIRPGKEDSTTYIYIAYREERIDERRDSTNAEYTGHAFLVESPNVDWSEQAPDNREKIELARIKWRGGRRLTTDQIDVSHVKRAGVRQRGSGAVRVQSGKAELSPTRSPQFSKDDDKFLIETFSDENSASGALYVANAFPVQVSGPSDARVQWRIESTITERREVQYHLYLKNFGTKSVDVRYEVYRLPLG